MRRAFPRRLTRQATDGVSNGRPSGRVHHESDIVQGERSIHIRAETSSGRWDVVTCGLGRSVGRIVAFALARTQWPFGETLCTRADWSPHFYPR